ARWKNTAQCIGRIGELQELDIYQCIEAIRAARSKICYGPGAVRIMHDLIVSELPRVDRRVGARAAVDIVIAWAPGDGVIASTPSDRVVSRSTIEKIIITVADNDIVATACDRSINRGTGCDADIIGGAGNTTEGTWVEIDRCCGGETGDVECIVWAAVPD